jgi:alkylation response protein AidB-like acyl-CoA dehydrogenase
VTDACRPAAGDGRAAKLRDAVEALGGQADRRAAEIEELRRLPADLSSALVDTGLGRAWAPSCYGGLELPVLELLDALESLATFEAGTAWCGMIAATTSLLGGYLPERWAEEIYGDPRAITGGHAAPQGRARPVEGGLLVAGTGSGARARTTHVDRRRDGGRGRRRRAAPRRRPASAVRPLRRTRSSCSTRGTRWDCAVPAAPTTR